MKTQPVYVVDIIDDMVKKVSLQLTPKLSLIENTITGVHYLYGHHNDIKKRLIEKTESNETKYTRYPLVALFQDFTETFDGSGKLKVKLQLIIGYHTEATAYMEDRYNKVFKPILYPIYSEFLEQISKSALFGSPETSTIKHEKIDRPHWGDPGAYGTTSYIFSDVLDAIEIRNIELSIDPSYCNKKLFNNNLN